MDEDRRIDADLWRGIFDASPDAIVVVDSDGMVIAANEQCRSVFGYEPEELLGRHIETLVPERYREGHLALRDGFLRHPGVREMGSGRELYAIRRDGSEFPVEISLSPLVTDDGVLVSAAVRDITERLRLQRESDRLRDELVATVSHELRTPLTSIIGYVELLLDTEMDTLSDGARRMLDVIQRNANRELHLVNDLLDLGSIGGATVDARHRVVLGGLARASVEGARITARSRGLSLAVDIEDGLEVLGDPQRLAQVIDNLVANAVKFSSPGDEVVLAGGRDGEAAWLEVRDQGAGISAEELPRIFDRLFRSSDAVREQVPGAGLGLTIAQAIVTAHGGRISASSELGKGTTMRVVLPVTTSEEHPS